MVFGETKAAHFKSVKIFFCPQARNVVNYGVSWCVSRCVSRFVSRCVTQCVALEPCNVDKGTLVSLQPAKVLNAVRMRREKFCALCCTKYPLPWQLGGTCCCKSVNWRRFDFDQSLVLTSVIAQVAWHLLLSTAWCRNVFFTLCSAFVSRKEVLTRIGAFCPLSTFAQFAAPSSLYYALLRCPPCAQVARRKSDITCQVSSFKLLVWFNTS